MLEDKSKKVPEGVEEIKDDELDEVAGGYSAETWLSMSKEERQKAVINSARAQKAGEYCAMNDPNL